MSGSSIGEVFRLFPDVVEAAENYREAKSDRDSRSLARRLTNETALYDQFLRRLLLVTSSSKSGRSKEDLLEKIQLHDQLGPENAGLLLSSLKEMSVLLRELKGYLTNTSKGSRVLDKLRPKPATNRATPKTPLRQKVDELSKINRKLGSYLTEPQISIPLPYESQGLMNFEQFFHQGKDAPEGIFNLVRNAFTCSCEESHVIAMRCRCPSCSKPLRENMACDYPWTLEILRLGQAHTVQSIATVPTALATEKSRSIVHSLPTLNIDSDDSTGMHTPPSSQASATDPSVIREHCTQSSELFKENVTSVSLTRHLCSAGRPIGQPSSLCLRMEGNTFRALVDQHISGRDPVPLSDLVTNRHVVLGRKRRMGLAFRLCYFVIRFLDTPWMPDNWNFEDWAVTFDANQPDGFGDLFLLRKFYSAESSTSIERKMEVEPQDSWPIMARDARLATLGLRLLELAMGKSLKEKGSEIIQDMGAQDFHPETQALFIAKKLLTEGKIWSDFGDDFADVITACVCQQFREGVNSVVRTLDPRTENFLERAARAITLPMYKAALKYFGPKKIAAPVKEARKPERRKDLNYIPGTENSSVRAAQGPLSDRLEKALGHALSCKDSTDEWNSERKPFRNDSHQITDSRAPSDPRASQSGSSKFQELLPTNHHEQRPNITEHSATPFGTEEPKTDSAGTVATEEMAQHSLRGSLDRSVAPKYPPTLDENTETRRSNDKVPIEQSRSVADIESQSATDDSTESEDSAFDWLEVERCRRNKAKLSPDHPFLQAKDIIMRIISREFQAWHTQGAGESVSGSNDTNQSSQAGSGAKKRRAAPDGGSLDKGKGIAPGGEEEDEDERDKPHVSKKRRRGNDDTGVNFACPFLKRNPMDYRDCAGYTLSRIRDVKQHLGRRHAMPIYCPRCNDTFNDENSRDKHIISGALCSPSNRPKPEGVLEEQRRRLAKKVPSKETPEEQWFRVYAILFGDDAPKPKSPYIDSRLLENVMAYQDFIRKHGYRILVEVLARHGALRGNLTNFQVDINSFHQEAFEEGFKRIFDAWADQASTSMPDLDGRAETNINGAAGSHAAGYYWPGEPNAGQVDRQDRQMPLGSYLSVSAHSHSDGSELGNHQFGRSYASSSNQSSHYAASNYDVSNLMISPDRMAFEMQQSVGYLNTQIEQEEEDGLRAIFSEFDLGPNYGSMNH